MLNDDYAPPSVAKARSQVAGLYSRGANPDPEVAAARRAELAVSLIDREIRQRVAETGLRLGDAEAAHLCGLIMSTAGVKYDATTVIEQVIRAAVIQAQTGDEK